MGTMGGALLNRRKGRLNITNISPTTNCIMNKSMRNKKPNAIENQGEKTKAVTRWQDADNQTQN